MLQPFEVLYEADLHHYRIPADLEEVYGGLGFPTPVLYSNFVSSLDGVVTLAKAPSAGSVLSGKHPADRFVMGLLRACADGVLLGAGTLRATPGHLWTPAHVFPDLAASFAAMRKGLGRAPEPALVLITASGKFDISHPAVRKGAIVMTTQRGKKTLGKRLPPTCEIVVAGRGERLDLRRALVALRKRGLQVLLTEGGPHVIGELLQKGVLDEMFLTISPVLAGRGDEKRLGMVEGVELLPGAGIWSSLLSARRHGDYLFTRYRIPAREGHD